MGREVIGGCSSDPEFSEYETGLIVKHLKEACGPAPHGVDIQVTLEGHEVGNAGDEVSYPVVSVVWDEGITEYPDAYIGKCIEAFERFDTPKEIYERDVEWMRLMHEIQTLPEKILDELRAKPGTEHHVRGSRRRPRSKP